MELYYTDKDFQSKVCNLRCDLEELAEYAREKWQSANTFNTDRELEDWGYAEDLLQELADKLAEELEYNED